MRKLIWAGAALLMLGATPAFARYPWCATSSANGGHPQCNYSSFHQCQAAIKGLGGGCHQNPALAHGHAAHRRPAY